MATKKAKPPKAASTPTEEQAPPVGPRPRLHKLRVSNFRSIGPAPVEIELDDIVVLVGPNNAGKSSILRAYQLVMEQGSKEGQIQREDFPHGAGSEAVPTIELETVVYDKTAPGDRWVRTDPETNDMFVRERWTWATPGPPKKVGWDVAANDWHASEGPWGAPHVAQARRPKPHYVSAFDQPAEQEKEITKLLEQALNSRVKDAKRIASEEQPAGPSEYEKLLESIRAIQNSMATDAVTVVEDVRAELEKLIGEV